LQVPARIVTVSRATEQQLLRRGVPGQGITVLHNAVRPQLRQIPAEASVLRRKKIDLEILPEEMVILCVGRLSKEKAQIDMVRAMQHLRQMSPKRAVRLMIVGDGPERTRISQAIQSADLGKRVVLAGHLKDPTPYYEAADVVAIPSLSEGSPNALLEAMAFGVPVVATEVGGIPEIVTHGETALLVPARNPGAMAAAIDLLFSNPDKGIALARQARRKVETDYSLESRANSLVSIYAEVNRLRS
jgi:glycosyltransferase involved in cell wall biosynthesis